MKERTEIIIVCAMFGLLLIGALTWNTYNYLTGAYG